MPSASAAAPRKADASPLDAAQVLQAVAALQKHLAKEAAAKNSLFDDDDMFSLVVALKKVPQQAKTKPHRLDIPHPIWQAEGSEVCLFVKDHQGEGHTAAKAKVAESADACGVAKVIGYSKLRANYKAHEARRRLCASFDLFLADDRVLPLLPKLLGKTFFKKKKQPVPVDLTKGDWGAAIKRATAGTYFFTSAGGCSAVRVARATSPAAHVAANAVAAAAGVAAAVPRGWANIRALYLKTNASVALPIYTALPDAREAAAAAPAAEAKAEAKAGKGGAAAPAAPAAAKAKAAAPAAANKEAKAAKPPAATAAAAAAAAPAPAEAKAAKKRPAAAAEAPPPAAKRAATRRA